MTRKSYDESEAMRVKAPPVIGGDDLFSPPTHQTPVRAHLRTVPGPVPPGGVQRKESALAGLAEGNADVIAWLREQLRVLYQRRWDSWALSGGCENPNLPFVCGDDVFRLLHDSPIWSERLDGPQQWRSAVWRKAFIKIPGLHVPSLRADQHAALLQCWRPVE